MKRVYKVEGLDCAHCADRLERAVLKVKGVSSAGVSFMAGKLAVEAEDEEVFAKVEEAAKKTVKGCALS